MSSGPTYAGIGPVAACAKGITAVLSFTFELSLARHPADSSRVLLSLQITCMIAMYMCSD